MIRILFYCFLVLYASSALAQNTVGLIYNSKESYNGYTLFTPLESVYTYLIDNCGYVVHQWEGTRIPKLSVYLLEDGSLLRTGCGKVYLYSWEGELLWFVNLNGMGISNHHDIEPLPNGNILVIGNEYIEFSEAIAKGRNPKEITNVIDADWIFEIEKVGFDSANLVWEWHAWDHLIQDFDETKENYGVISEHPELLDINISFHSQTYLDMDDWMHCNGLDYNAELDQIIFSSRHFSEIYIIDHSTTTEEAASHQGGNSGKGGDFLWRWGNPESYNSGDFKKRRLFGQHDPKWISEGYHDEGKISIFNNGFERSGNYSSVHIIDPPLQADGSYAMEENRFLPDTYYYSWHGDVLDKPLFAPFGGGVEVQPNGNILVAELHSRFFEITPQGEVAWVYVNPAGETIINQYEVNPSLTFRAERYSPNYVAFEGRDLSPTNYIENENLVSDACSTFITISDIQETVIAPNPTNQFIYIFTLLPNFEYVIHNSFGQIIETGYSDTDLIDVSTFNKGIYFLEIKNEEQKVNNLHKFVVQ